MLAVGEDFFSMYHGMGHFIPIVLNTKNIFIDFKRLLK